MIEISDDELIMLYQEMNEDATEIILRRYNKLIKFLIKKYYSDLSKLRISFTEIYNECLMALMNALNNYNSSFDSSFYTFAYLVIGRTIKKSILKSSRLKNHALNESLSLNYYYEEMDVELIDLIEASKPDVLDNMISDEVIMDINEYGRTHLSKFEYEVYKKLIHNISYKDIAKELNKSYKQITSTIERIRRKLREKVKVV